MIEVCDREPHDAALNMAIDETLLRHARAPILRIYCWARPAVSFGYFGKWADAARAWPERELVRRWTGGGIVPHGNDVTYSLFVPRDHPFFTVSPRESYCAIHECVAGVLKGAVLAGLAAPQTSAACFENPVQHDVLIENRKVAGGAQRRTKCGLLHQGSIQNAGCVTELSERFSSRRDVISLAPEIQAEAVQLAHSKYATKTWTRRI